MSYSKKRVRQTESGYVALDKIEVGDLVSVIPYVENGPAICTAFQGDLGSSDTIDWSSLTINRDPQPFWNNKEAVIKRAEQSDPNDFAVIAGPNPENWGVAKMGESDESHGSLNTAINDPNGKGAR